MREKIFEKFKIKDIVFLAIISAVALCTCAVMPLVASLQTTVFGIAQAVTGLQLSIFFAIGLMKVRKMGALFIMAFLTGLFQLMMAPPMFFSNLIIGLILEILVALIFRGYKEDRAIFFAVLLYNPLSLPFNLLYNYLFGREAMVAGGDPAALADGGHDSSGHRYLRSGAWIGIRISRELKKSGAMKR